MVTCRVHEAIQITAAVYVEDVAIWKVCDQRMQQLFSSPNLAARVNFALS
jgi:hypothetical protein